jgi:hypothetical protein
VDQLQATQKGILPDLVQGRVQHATDEIKLSLQPLRQSSCLSDICLAFRLTLLRFTNNGCNLEIAFMLT